MKKDKLVLENNTQNSTYNEIENNKRKKNIKKDKTKKK